MTRFGPAPTLHNRAHRRAEAKKLYRALQEHAHRALELADSARREPAHFRRHAYREFLEKIRDFEALSGLLRTRLQDVASEWIADQEDASRTDRVREDFDRLDLLMLSLFVRTSRRYFTFLSLNPDVPLGALEWLQRDLPPLLRTLNELRDPAMASRIDPGLDAELTTAILIVNDVMGRLPALPNLDAPDPDAKK